MSVEDDATGVEARELDAAMERGREAATAGRFREALEAFEAALAIDDGEAEALYGRAFSLRKLGRYDEAGAALEQALYEHPDDVRLRRELGLLHRSRGDRDAALASFDEALELDPYDEGALSWKLTTLRELLRLDEAERALDEAELRLGERPLLTNERGFLHDTRREYAEALAQFERTLELDALNAIALTWRVTELRQLRRFDEAERALDEAVEIVGPESVALVNERGWLFDDRGEYEQALAQFERALELDSGNVIAFTWRVTELRQLRRFDEAERALDEAVAVIGETPAVVTERGWLFNDLGEHEQALAQFERALELDPVNASALIWRVTELRHLRRFDEAERALDEAVGRLGSETVALVNERGWLHTDRGDLELALAEFRRAVELDRLNEQALTWRVTLLRQLRRFAEAGTALDEAFERLGETAALRNERGLLCSDRGEHENALAEFERALELDPANGMALSWRVTELRFLRRFREAEEKLREAIARLGETPVFANEQGLLETDRGRHDAALARFERALELEPTNVFALAWRAASLRQLRRLDEAERALAAARELVGEHPSLLVEQGWVALERERYDEAVKLFRRAAGGDAGRNPLLGELAALSRARRVVEGGGVAERLTAAFENDLDVRDEVGWFFLNANDPRRAREQFEFILARDKDNVAGINGMGGLHFNAEEYELAEQCFRRAVDADGESALFVRNLAWSLAYQGDEEKRREAQELCERILQAARSTS